MTYAEAIRFLQDLQWFGAKLGLENTIRLAERAGNPHHELRFIHVAGTNGKGSTCAFLENIYRASGRRTGLFTSPHLVRFGERIQVDRSLIPEPEIIRLVALAQEWCRDFPTGSHPTFFEVVTVVALRYFAEQRCEIVIWETGMGGRLDATNIVTPVASVITSIALDHQQWLGETIEEIAREKAGIIKPGVPVITAAQSGAGLEVLVAVAERERAPLTIVTRNDTISLQPSLRGEHQKLNAATALATVRVLSKALPVSPEHIARGLSTAEWAGRLQVVERPNGQIILMDGAHNLAGIQALRAELDASFTGIAPTIVFGVLHDKKWREMLSLITRNAAALLLTPLKSTRSLRREDVIPFCRKLDPALPVRICDSVASALRAAADAPLLIVTGSLYLVGEALEALGLASAPSNPERSLNEYSPRRPAP